MEIDLPARAFAGKPVLGRIRLSLAKGERIAVLGPSGIGKSTLLRIAAGIDRDHPGRVTGAERAAVVFQEPVLLPWRTALQNILLATRVPEAQARARLEEVGLAGKADLYPRQLSLGQQRRLALARAFATSPEILLMDEPFASLDRDTAARMLDLTAALLDRSGAGLMLVTHDPSEALRLRARTLTLSGQPATLA